MLGRTTGAVLQGVTARLIHVEADLGGGLPAVAAVGLPDSAVREGLDRIRAALRHSGFQLPQRRVVVNLAPAEIRKHGAGLDLPIAAAVLAADGQLPGDAFTRALLVGELSLDGRVRAVRGALATATAARDAGLRRVVVARDVADEAALVEGVDVFPVEHLSQLSTLGRQESTAHRVDARAILGEAARAAGAGTPDLADVRGQPVARRALEVAAAGGHHLLLLGPPGAGKTLLATRLPGILPPLQLDEALGVTRVWSASGLSSGLIARRPFRAPHHGVTAAGLVGGGRPLMPGEISLAHHGVLYLDEVSELRRDALEALRQPLEEGAVRVVRAGQAVDFPARFQLVASMNPCPCGFHGEPGGRCRCSPAEVRRYACRLSGPMLDRFDLVVRLSAPDPAEHQASATGEASAAVRDRVLAARARQLARARRGAPSTNAALGPADRERWAPLTAEARRLSLSAARRLGLTARAMDRVRRVARTVADLGGADEVGAGHLAEALQYRTAPELGGIPERPV